MMKIPLALPEITEDDIQAVTRVLRTPWQSLGPQLNEFESSLAQYTGTAHAVAVNSGTSALHLCMRALHIGEGAEVIVPSFTFIAVANAVRYEKAIPVFADIEPQHLNLDPNAIEDSLTHKTRAIMVPHTFGCPAEMQEILDLARLYDLFVIEDACEAIGAEYDGMKAGSLGQAGVFGFYPNKQITTGEGGAIVTNNAEVNQMARSMRNQGRTNADEWFEHDKLGYNYRLPEINCALGTEQLKRIASTLARRKHVAQLYASRLGNNADIILPSLTASRRRISWFAYVVRLGPRFSRMHRDWIRNEMIARGIGCGRYFAPIHLQRPYQNDPRQKHNLSTTEFIADRCLALPFFNSLSENQVDEVCDIFTMLARQAASMESGKIANMACGA